MWGWGYSRQSAHEENTGMTASDQRVCIIGGINLPTYGKGPTVIAPPALLGNSRDTALIRATSLSLGPCFPGITTSAEYWLYYSPRSVMVLGAEEILGLYSTSRRRVLGGVASLAGG
jgi:hypothetical protein